MLRPDRRKSTTLFRQGNAPLIAIQVPVKKIIKAVSELRLDCGLTPAFYIFLKKEYFFWKNLYISKCKYFLQKRFYLKMISKNDAVSFSRCAFDLYYKQSACPLQFDYASSIVPWQGLGRPQLAKKNKLFCRLNRRKPGPAAR